MIIATLQAMGTLKPKLTIHGNIAKIDLGALLLEMDKETFRNMMKDLLIGAVEHEIYFYPLVCPFQTPKGPGAGGRR